MLKDYKKIKLEKGGVYLFLVKKECADMATLERIIAFFKAKGIQMSIFVVPNLKDVKAVDFSDKTFKDAVLDIVTEAIKTNSRPYLKQCRR